LVAGVLLHGGYLGGVFWAVEHGLPAGIAALISGLQPLLAGLLVGPLLGERVSLQRWAGILLGFGGAVLVVAPRLGGIDAIPPAAVIVCFGGMVSITLGTIWQKRTAAAVDLRTNTVVQFLGATALTLPIALVFERAEFTWGPELVIGLFWAVFGLSIGAIALLLILIRRGAVARVSALLFLVPPVAALMAYFMFGETLTPVQIAGMVLAAIGVAIASRP
jgi:drug/metabolite transporter (DMT)-like permease